MMHTFYLPGIKPLSINSTYTNVGKGRAKTQAARDWTTEFFHTLSTQSNLDNLMQLREKFNPEEHYYSIKIEMQYPESIFWKKGAGISAKTVDLSNFEKSIIDCLFLPKFHVTPFPYGCENLNIDDKYVAELRSSKVPGDQHSVKVVIEIKSLDLLR
jgi:hypothetical protein